MSDTITEAIAEWRKHGTPGPWEMTRANHLDGTAEMMFSNRARDKLGKEWLSEAWFDFARTWIRQRGASEDYPTCKANARLIAAAPEMAARVEALSTELAEVKAEARSWQTVAEANQATAQSHVERWAEAERIITDLIGSTDMPWAEAVGRAESFLYAKNEKAND